MPESASRRMTCAQTALWLHKQGYVVIPERGMSAEGQDRRIPTIKWNQIRKGELVPSPTLIGDWFSDPRRGLGVLNGPRSRVLIADVDARDGGLEGVLESAVRDQSGRGEGEHVWWAWTEDMQDLAPLFEVDNPVALAPGTQIPAHVLGMPGVEIPLKVTVPPSLHWLTEKSGRWLTGLPERSKLQRPPTALLDYLRGLLAGTSQPMRRKVGGGVGQSGVVSDGSEEHALAASAEWYDHMWSRRWSNARKVLVNRAVGVMARDGAPRGRIMATIQGWNQAQCDPPRSIDEVRKQVESVLSTIERRESGPAKPAAQVEQGQADAWDPDVTWGPEPTPFPTKTLLSHVPWLHSMVLDVARTTHTPPEFAAFIALSAAAHFSSGRKGLKVKGGWREPPCLLSCGYWPSGHGKTRPYSMLLPHIQSVDNKHEQLAKELRADASAGIDILKAERSKILKGKNAPDRDRLREIHQEINEETRRLRARGTSHTEAGTVEGAREILIWTAIADPNGVGRCYFFTDEGDAFFHMIACRYSDTADYTLVLKAYSGTGQKVDNKGDQYHVENSFLSGCLLPQDDTLQKLQNDGFGKNLRMQEKGLLGRVLHMLPPTYSARPVSEEKPDQRLFQEFRNALHNLDGSIMQQHTCSYQSREMFDALRMSFLRRAEPSGDLSSLSTWALRGAEKAARVALALHSLKYAGKANWPRELDHDIVRSCCDFAQGYALDHARLAWTHMSFDQVDVDAKKIWQRFGHQEKIACYDNVTKRAQNSVQFKPARAKAAFKRGEEYGFWRVQEDSSKGRSKRVLVTNPHVRLDRSK